MIVLARIMRTSTAKYFVRYMQPAIWPIMLSVQMYPHCALYDIWYSNPTNYRLQQRGVLWSQNETSVVVLTNCIPKACAWCKNPDIKPDIFGETGRYPRDTREIGSRLLGEINDTVPDKSAAHCIWWTLPSQYYQPYDLVYSCQRFININRIRKYLGGADDTSICI